MSKWSKLYDKYSGKKSKSESHYSFWADEFELDYDSSSIKSVMSDAEIDTMKKYRLSSARKAIGNFVTIATGKAIPVKFGNGQQSYTDGKSVVLSGDIDDTKKFDVGVGLALHEGSHILLSDFEFLQKLAEGLLLSVEQEKKGLDVGIRSPLAYIKDLLNIVEDRRIDSYIYAAAPGYREYYLKLYSKYFGDKIITEALMSEWTEETSENYMNRLINIMNPASSLTALKGLRRIWNVLDVNNISRLKNTQDAYSVAEKIYDIICESLAAAQADGTSQKQQPQAGKGQQGSQGEQNESSGEGNESDSNSSSSRAMSGGSDNTDEESRGGNSMSAEGEGDEGDDSDGGGDAGDAGDGDGSTTGSSSTASKSGSTMTSAKQNKLSKIVKEQKDFLNGRLKKKKVSAKLQQEIDAVESAGAELTHVANNFDGQRGVKGCEVVVLKQLTRKMLEEGTIKLAYNSYSSSSKQNELHENLKAEQLATAERMGVMMAKKLQVRNEARTTVFNRQRHGKIDRRLVHSLGFDAETVFNQLHIDKYKKANIHLSIDASSSMCGHKWNQTMINTIALAKAVSSIQNLSMQVSIRWSDDKLPIVLIAYDSRKDSYQKVKSLFPYLHANGTTPEGLCFEAIAKLLVPATPEMDSYFVNISDGEPCFSNGNINYTGAPAEEHTKKQMNKIRGMGIGVTSYYVSDRKRDKHPAFDNMYGKDARYIDINHVGEVTSTLNRMFLTKAE